MLRYYKKALRELEEKNNEKHQAVGELAERYGGEVENSRESSHKHGNKRDKELKRKKKKRTKTTETALETRHDHLADEERKKTKKVKKRKRKEIDVDATNSDDRESCKTKLQKPRTDPQTVSNNKEVKKKRKREYLSEFSEEDVKKIKHACTCSVQTTESEKHRHEEKCGEIYISCNQRTENAHTSVESSTLERSRYSYAISPSGSSLQSSTRHSKKASGKVCTKEGHKKKEKRRNKLKMREDLTANKVDLADGNDNKTDVIESVVEPSFISTINMDKAKLREATVISNIIHETKRVSKERLQALAKQGIKVNKGKWTRQELELLKFNMACYLEHNNLPNPTKVLFNSSMIHREDRLYWRHFVKSTNCYRELGKGIQRELESIYSCTKRIYNKKNYVGRYSEKEVKQLRRLHAIHGNNWVTVGKMMGRSNMSVVRKYASLPPKGEKLAQRGTWTDDELKRLKEAVHTVTKTSTSDEQSMFRGIHWSAVAALVMTRNTVKCRRKWLEKLCWSTTTTADETQGVWTKSHYLKLITRLYNSGVMDECDVDWMELKSEYEINYSPQWLRKKWSKVKKRVPNYHQLSFEDIVDYLYRVYGQTLRDEIETGKSIKDTDACDAS